MQCDATAQYFVALTFPELLRLLDYFAKDLTAFHASDMNFAEIISAVSQADIHIKEPNAHSGVDQDSGLPNDTTPVAANDAQQSTTPSVVPEAATQRSNAANEPSQKPRLVFEMTRAYAEPDEARWYEDTDTRVVLYEDEEPGSAKRMSQPKEALSALHRIQQARKPAAIIVEDVDEK